MTTGAIRGPIVCANCGTEVSGQLAAGRAYCSACRSALPEELIDTDAASDRRRWRKAFWWTFLATPAATFLIALIPQALESSSPLTVPLGPLGTNAPYFSIAAAPATGAIAAGYCFMKQRGETLPWWQKLLEPVVYAAVILIVYTGILIFGCSLYASVARHH